MSLSTIQITCAVLAVLLGYVIWALIAMSEAASEFAEPFWPEPGEGAEP